MSGLSPAVPDAMLAAAWLADGYRCNTGGPMSRTRTEHVYTTVLGEDEGPIRCPRVLRVALDFGRRKPLRCVAAWLDACGFADEAAARAAITLPAQPCICQPDPLAHPIPVGALTPHQGLYFALVLGLCTAVAYDPSRPVIWTTTSLTRQLVLYDGGGFYA